MLYVNYTSLFFKDFICLFLDRGEGREEEGEKHQCVVECAPYGGPGLQSRHLRQLGIKLWFVRGHSVH